MTLLLADELGALPVLDADSGQLAAEVGIATVEKIDAVDEAFAIGCSGCDHIGEAGAEIGNHEFGATQFRGTNHNCGMSVVGGAKSATCWSEALGKDLDLGAEAAKRIGVTKAIFVHGFVYDAHAVGLCEGSDERRLPVGHEARMNIGFECKGAKHSTSSVKGKRVAIGIDFEVAACSAVHVQER
jgi:hypothetical protein